MVVVEAIIIDEKQTRFLVEKRISPHALPSLSPEIKGDVRRTLIFYFVQRLRHLPSMATPPIHPELFSLGSLPVHPDSQSPLSFESPGQHDSSKRPSPFISDVHDESVILTDM